MTHLCVSVLVVNAGLWGPVIARSSYRVLILAPRETSMRMNLRVIRHMVDQYTADKERAPLSLEELVRAGYLPKIPVDPMTGSADTWVVILEDQDPVALYGQRGIKDVRSGCDAYDSSGTLRYCDW